jgi:hypothetical protein
LPFNHGTFCVPYIYSYVHIFLISPVFILHIDYRLRSVKAYSFL